jgi:Amt family ammonium transporter
MGKWLVPRVYLFLFVCLICQPLLAQTAPPASPAVSAASSADANTRIAKLEQQVADAKSSADNGWMLMSSALVLMMTGPGLALFYGGLVRKKNVLGTMMQSFAMMAVITVLWGLFSFSLAFGSGNGLIGGLHHLFCGGWEPRLTARMVITGRPRRRI